MKWEKMKHLKRLGIGLVMLGALTCICIGLVLEINYPKIAVSTIILVAAYFLGMAYYD